MKKIGIVTTFANYNFGSALQSYALQTTLRRLGFEPENIRYSKERKPPWIYLGKIALAWLYRYFKVKNRKGAFNAFRMEYISEGKKRFHTNRELEETNARYDAFICGSDQIWAPNLYDPWHFLAFADAKKLKVAYAPSIGLPTIPDPLKEKVTNHLNELDHVSIREKQGKDLIRELTGKEVPVVLDPTLLLQKDDWEKLGMQSESKAPYALCYFLGENPRHRQLAKQYSEAHGLRMISPKHEKGEEIYDEVLEGVGPREFLGLVSGAQMVFTDSFHGTAFSVNLERPFFTFLRFKPDDELCQNSRIFNFLELTGLRQRLVSDEAESLEGGEEVEFELAHRRLSDARKNSMDYLQEALKAL